MAHNEGILENVTSLGGLGFILGQIVQCNFFLKFEEFLGVPTGLPNIPDPLYTRKGIFTKGYRFCIKLCSYRTNNFPLE